MSIQAKPELDVDQHFKEITANLTAPDESLLLENNDRITVALHLPYLAEYDLPTLITLVYGCTFKVELGDSVECPPTPRGDNSWNIGVVVALDGGSYTGPIKYVRKIDKGSK